MIFVLNYVVPSIEVNSRMACIIYSLLIVISIHTKRVKFSNPVVRKAVINFDAIVNPYYESLRLGSRVFQLLAETPRFAWPRSPSKP